MDENLLRLITNNEPPKPPDAHDAWERALPSPGLVFPTPIAFEWIWRPIATNDPEGGPPVPSVMLTVVTPTSVQIHVFSTELLEQFIAGAQTVLAYHNGEGPEAPTTSA